MKNHMNGKHSNKHYAHLLIMAVLSFISMYILMYAMVDRLENVYPNFNQFYMAGLMAAPMVVIELIVMRSMYENKKLNTITRSNTMFSPTRKNWPHSAFPLAK